MPRPTLDVQHLQKLAEEASPEAADIFAGNYADLLPERVERIIRTVSFRNRETAIDALLSLKSASWLAGALRMNQLCREMELALTLADQAAAISIGQDIELHLPRLQDALCGRSRLALEPDHPTNRPAPR